MERKLKILKAVLLLRQVNRCNSKEEQMADVDRYYSDEQLDRWIDMMQHPEKYEIGDLDDDEMMEPIKEEDCRFTSSMTNDYSPSHPWDAPGMSIRDFI